jgi:uncharacterized membrane protein YfhO
MPDALPSQPQDFSFSSFSVSEHRIAFDATIPEDGFVLLNEAYYPGWEARVDGQPSRIFPADGLFRALYLTAGSHRIEMVFRPPYFFWGAAISILTLLLAVIYLRRASRQRAVPASR